MDQPMINGFCLEDLLKTGRGGQRGTRERLMAAVARSLITGIPRVQATPNAPRVADFAKLAEAGPLLRLELGFPALFQAPPATTELRRFAAGLSLIDFYNGLGGSSFGALQAGIPEVTGFNHWPESVAIHAINIPGDTWICDLSVFQDYLSNGYETPGEGPDPFEPVDLVWNGPPCPPHSQARRTGKVSKSDRRTAAQREKALAKARAAVWAALEYVNLHREHVKAVITENVPGFVRWKALPAWIQAWECYGYHTRVISLNSMFAGPADQRPPQSRDRVYFVHIRNDYAPKMDWDFTVEAECRPCNRTVQAVQVWKRAARARPVLAGVYGPHGQYIYACPLCQEQVSPRTRGVDVAIDYCDQGTPIASRSLGATTMARIQAGLDRLVALGLPPQPLLVTQDRSDQPEAKPARPVSWPSPTLTGRQVLGLVFHPDLLPPGSTTEPATRLPTAAECSFRMVTPDELKQIQGLPTDYFLGAGSKRDRTLAIGNAVSPAAAQLLLERSMMALAA